MTEPLVFVTFKWRAPIGYRSSFTGHHVDVLRRMVGRHYFGDHRFVVITDDASGITEPDVEIMELWDAYNWVPNPSGRKNPSCYRRLRLFARNVGEWLGPRFVCLDLDCVITGQLNPLFDNDDDFRIWRSATSGNPYNGSMWQLRAGSRPQAWENFDPQMSPRLTKASGLYGSDQAWMAYALPGAPTWGREHGVLSYRNDLHSGADPLPADARIVFFHGKIDPWSSSAQARPWVRDNWK